MIKKYEAFFSSLIVLTFSILLFIGTLDMRTMTTNTTSPELLPRILATALLIVGTIILINGILKFRKNNHVSPVQEVISTHEREPFLAKHMLLLTFLSILFYVFFLNILGFILTTTLYMTVQTHILMKSFKLKQTIIHFIIYGILAYLVFLLFTTVLTVVLPEGIIKLN